MSGDADFILKCVALTLQSLEAFVEDLTVAANVASVRITLTIRRIKDDLIVPIE